MYYKFFRKNDYNPIQMRFLII